MHVDAPFVGVAACVAHQVADHHLQHPRRRMQLHRAIAVQVHRHRASPQQFVGVVHFIADDVVDVEQLDLRFDVCLAGQDQERIDHRFHVAASPLDALQAAAQARLQAFITQCHVAGNADDGQRRAQFMAGIAGEVALACHVRADPVGQRVQRGRQLPGLALHVRRQLVGLQVGRFRMPRVPARDAPSQPVHRRHQALGRAVGHPAGAIHRQQGQQHRHDAEPERQHLCARAQEHQVQAASRAHINQHQLVVLGQFVEAGLQIAQVRRQRQCRLPAFQQVAADVLGIGRWLHRGRFVQRPVVRRLLAQGSAHQAVLDHQRDQPRTQQDAQAGQHCLQDEGDTDLARQAVRHCGVPVRALRL